MLSSFPVHGSEPSLSSVKILDRKHSHSTLKRRKSSWQASIIRFKKNYGVSCRGTHLAETRCGTLSHIR